jgi:hypothetical protein
MAQPLRLPLLLRGVPGRLAAVTCIGAIAVGSWALWPQASGSALPPSLALDGKHPSRLAFSADETELPVRESRIFDTLAMFAQPQAQPRPWSDAPILATAAEAGIRPMAPRSPAPRLAKLPEAKPAEMSKPVRTASALPAQANGPSGAHPNLLGWELPAAPRLPSRRDAARMLDKVGDGAVALGSGTVGVVSRTASAFGSTVAGAGSAIADTLGLD